MTNLIELLSWHNLLITEAIAIAIMLFLYFTGLSRHSQSKLLEMFNIAIFSVVFVMPIILFIKFGWLLFVILVKAAIQS
jgi:hypothetical protein